MEEVTQTPEMWRAAKKLNEGPLIYVYRDGTNIRAETQDGDDPYVWRDGEWRKMTMRLA